jgi:hypothetical protein
MYESSNIVELLQPEHLTLATLLEGYRVSLAKVQPLRCSNYLQTLNWS